jgi:AcrR family transcriptional regulator
MPRPNVEKERREQILEAAMICFSRKGYHATSMDDITAELPFSKALIYYYFKTKRDVFMSILEDWMQKTTLVWETMLSSEDNATIQLRKCMEYGVQLILQFSDLARVEFEFYAEARRDEEVRQIMQRIFSRFRDEFQGILEAGIANGEFRLLNTEALSAALFGMYEGLAIQAVVEPDTFDWSSVLESSFDMVMQGIAPVEA